MVRIQEVVELSETRSEPVNESVSKPVDEPATDTVDERADGDRGDDGLTLAQVTSQLSLLVQSLQDALPDDAVTFVRRRLALGDVEAAASSLLFAALQFRVPVSGVEYAVFAECLEATGADTQLLEYLGIAEDERPLLFTFVARPGDLIGEAELDDGPAADPAPAAAHAEDELVIAIDAAVLDRVGTDPGVLGVWRAWRYPMTGAPWPEPRACYLVELRDEDAATRVAAAFYGPDSSEPAGRPLVETYATGKDLPSMHRAIQLAGDLVQAQDSPDFAFADVFEGAPGEDGASPDVVRIEGEEAERILSYLLGGRPLMSADAHGDDLMDDALTGVVPLHLRTDGHWIWSEASAYYLSRYGIAPPSAFRAALAGRDPVVAPVPDAVAHQAVIWLSGLS